MIVIAVDDERFALENLVESIEQASPDAQIHRFRYPEDALDFAKANHVDVAFLDVEMIDMNGVELAERLKLYHPNINIIFSTGYGHYRDAAFDLHASGYLTKPITPEKVKRNWITCAVRSGTRSGSESVPSAISRCIWTAPPSVSSTAKPRSCWPIW